MVCSGDVQLQFQYIPEASEEWAALAGRLLEMTSARLQITGADYIVIMTNGQGYDLEVLDPVLRGDFAYVGIFSHVQIQPAAPLPVQYILMEILKSLQA